MFQQIINDHVLFNEKRTLLYEHISLLSYSTFFNIYDKYLEATLYQHAPVSHTIKISYEPLSTPAL